MLDSFQVLQLFEILVPIFYTSLSRVRVIKHILIHIKIRIYTPIRVIISIFLYHMVHVDYMPHLTGLTTTVLILM